MMYDRTLIKTVKEVSKGFPVLLITGPRQVGKTTLLNMCSENDRNYVTLDSLEDLYLAHHDPKLFLETYKPPIIIDEIQYAPNLLKYIKMAVDEKKSNGMYWLTGSQKFELMKGLTESLAGRIAVLDLLGLSHYESTNQANKHFPFMPTLSWLEQIKNLNSESISETYQRIWQGSFPKVTSASKNNRDIFYRSYLQTYIQRDIRDILNVTDSLTFLAFLKSLAARTGQQLNYNNLAKEIGIDNKTVKSWLSVLQTSGIIYLLQPYSNNLSKRLTKSPKIYFLDTGLCCYLTNWPDATSLENGIMSGAILETYVFSELLKSYWHNGTTPNIYYYRDNAQREIDFLIEAGNTLYPIEIKRTTSPTIQQATNFKALKTTGKQIGSGAILCFTEKARPLTSEILAIPVFMI